MSSKDRIINIECDEYGYVTNDGTEIAGLWAFMQQVEDDQDMNDLESTDDSDVEDYKPILVSFLYLDT